MLYCSMYVLLEGFFKFCFSFQFEGGLGITATTISGVYKLAEAAKKAPALTAVSD